MTSRFDRRDFQCPGEPASISRAVHLARLADGYPLCHECQYRDDTEGLTERLKRKIPPMQSRKRFADFLTDEGLLGELHDGFDPPLAGRLAAGFALVLREHADASSDYPTVAIATDGRAITQPHLATIAERLRWIGCHILDLGPIPCPALPCFMSESDVDGGVYIGNPLGSPHSAGIRFFSKGGRPVTGNTSLQSTAAWLETDPVRPVRRSGGARRADALGPYLSRFAQSYHGLRPLRFLLHTTCRPAGACVERLLDKTACRMELRVSESAIPDESLPGAGHFAAAIEDDGQRLCLWDERGNAVPFQDLLLLIATMVYRNEPSSDTIVIGQGDPEITISRLEQRGLAVQPAGPLPSDVHAAMAHCGAALGAGSAERIWFQEPGGSALPDALGTITLLLARLSEGDRPLSEVLDAEDADR